MTKHTTVDAAQWLRERGLPPLGKAEPVEVYCRRVGERFDVHVERFRGRYYVVVRDLRGGRMLVPLDLAVDVSKAIDGAVTAIVAHEVKAGRTP